MKFKFNLEEMMWQARFKSINQLSETSGISRPTLEAIQKNRSKQVHLRTLSKLCSVLDCNIDDLLIEDEGQAS